MDVETTLVRGMCVRMEFSCASHPDTALAWVATPSRSRARAVCLLIHGFALPGSAYTALAKEFASRGYTVVVPDVVYSATDPVGTETPKVQAWIDRIRDHFTHPNVVLIGHSRGGQACLNYIIELYARGWREIEAVILLDPVEGSVSLLRGGRLRPFLLANTQLWPASMYELPLLIVGAGLGPTGRFPAAPDGHNYKAIWDALRLFARDMQNTVERFRATHPPHFLIEATSYGHLDFLNNPGTGEGVVAAVSQYLVRGNRTAREDFRNFVAEVSSAFLGACSDADASSRVLWYSMFALDPESSFETSGHPIAVRYRRIPQPL